MEHFICELTPLPPTIPLGDEWSLISDDVYYKPFGDRFMLKDAVFSAQGVIDTIPIIISRCLHWVILSEGGSYVFWNTKADFSQTFYVLCNYLYADAYANICMSGNFERFMLRIIRKKVIVESYGHRREIVVDNDQFFKEFQVYIIERGVMKMQRDGVLYELDLLQQDKKLVHLLDLPIELKNHICSYLIL
jgi:hypothetical protein